MNLLIGLGKPRGGGGGEERVESKIKRSHSWDSTFQVLSLRSMKKREKQQAQSRRGGFGVKERQLRYDEEHEEYPSPSRGMVLWNRKSHDETITTEEEEDDEISLSKEDQQQLFVQKLFSISKQILDETPPERKMSLLSSRSQSPGVSSKEMDAPTRQRSLLTGLQPSFVTGIQTVGGHDEQPPSKPTTTTAQAVSSTKERRPRWTVETVVTSLTSSCTGFDSLCTPSFSLLTLARPQQRRRAGPTPAVPPNKKRLHPLEQTIPIPVTISFTKQGPPLGWEESSLHYHITELDKYEHIDDGGDFDEDINPATDECEKDEADHASSTGFISLTSSIPTRRSHGLWSTTDLYPEH